MLFVLVKGDSCLEPIQENPEDLVTKWSFVPGLSLPPSHLLPDPAASVISSFLTSLIFPFHCLLPCGQHNCSGCPDPQRQQNLPMNLFPSKLRSHLSPVTAPLLPALLPHLLFIPRPSAAQILPHLGQRMMVPTNSSKLFLLASLAVNM